MSVKQIVMAAAGALGGGGGGGEDPYAWDLAYAYYDPPEIYAWNIATAYFTNASLLVSAQESSPQDLFFKPDGTKMYIVGASGDEVNEYSLSTAWDITTASYVQNFSILAQDGAPFGLFFKPDGTKMYMVGVDFDSVYEYNLSTDWDISTASYAQSFSVQAEDTQPTGVFFKPDGTRMYIVGSVGDEVDEYSLSTPWDISTASHVQSFSVNAEESTPTGLFFKPDGTRMYIVGDNGDEVNEYSLSTSWDVSTASYVRRFFVSSQLSVPNGIFFKPDGSAMYIVGSTSDRVWQYSLGSHDVRSQEASSTDLFFKADGTKMYVIGYSGDDVNEYNLSTPWDTSTAIFVQNFAMGTEETSPRGLFFKPDGTKIYMVGSSGDDVNEYSLSTAWDVGTASYVQSFSVGAQETIPNGVFFKPDGTKMYVIGSSGDDVNEYSLSTAWDVSTASFVQNTFVIANPEGLHFKPDGTKMYAVSSTDYTVNEYSLSTPWDTSTISYVQNFSIADQLPGGVFFKTDGTKMYVIGSGADAIFTYSIGI